MTAAAIPALEELSNLVLSLRDLVPAEHWAEPSACQGWSAHDVLIHLVCTLRETLDPDSLPPGVAGDIEATNNRQVEAFRHQSIEETFADYAELIGPALRALTQMQEEGARDEAVGFENAGAYPAHLVADSLVFDHYCHLRHDLAAPRGPLEEVTLLAEAHLLGPSLEWLIAGLPQMDTRPLLEALTKPVRLQLEGPAGGTWTLYRTREGRVVAAAGASCLSTSTLVSTPDDFVLWGTRRVPPHEARLLVTVQGDQHLGHAVRRAIHVY